MTVGGSAVGFCSNALFDALAAEGGRDCCFAFIGWD